MFIPKKPAIITRRALITGAAALASHDALAQGVPGIGGIGGFTNHLGATTTWNPLDAGSGFTFSAGNLAASCATTSRIVRATQARGGSGQYYFEITLTAIGNSAKYGNWGVALAGASLGLNLGFDAYGWGYDAGRVLNNGRVAASGGSSFVQGDIASVAVDFNLNLLYFGKNSLFFYGGDGVPIPSGMFFPAVGDQSLSTGANTFTANFGQFPFALTVPTGFKAWG